MIFPFSTIIFWSRTTKHGMMWSMILAATTITCPFLNIPMDNTIFGFIVSLVSVVLISLLTKHAKGVQVRKIH